MSDFKEEPHNDSNLEHIEDIKVIEDIEDILDNEHNNNIPINNSDNKDLVIVPTYYEYKRENNTNVNKPLKRVLLLTCIASILGGLSLGIGLGISLPIAQGYFRADHSADIPTIEYQNVVYSDSSQPLNLVEAVNKVTPSVVSISTTSSLLGNRGLNQFPTMFDFEVPSSGTGIIFDEDDEKIFIVTNEHVIENADSISISMNRSADIPAKLLGKDVQSDLAVIYVLKSDLKAAGINEVVIAEFGSSSDMQVGEVVIAIGNALGQGNTTTMGIVSAKNIQIPIDGRLLTVLQTDAAINPGNSGGPLINTQGEVIGINTVKLAKENVHGMGYSITSDVAIPIMYELRNQTPRPYLGIRGNDVTENIAEMFNLEPTGVFVHSIYEGSGAYIAGIQPTDIITHLNGEPILNMAHLSSIIQSSEVGDELQIQIIRDGNEVIILDVVLTLF